MVSKEKSSKKKRARVVEIDNMRKFTFNKCAAFCKKLDDFDSSILKEFYEVCKKKFLLMTDLKQNQSHGTKYCFFAFKKHPQSPAFCQLDDFKELKSGYFLSVSYKNFIAFFCNNIVLPKAWNSVTEKIGYDDFVNFNVNGDTEFKYLSMKNIDGADYVIKKKTFEGNNLRNNVSSFASSKFYVQTMRGSNKLNKDESAGDEKRKTFSVNFGTAKFNQYESGLTIGNTCDWVRKTVDQMIGASTTDDYFLKNFAKRMQLEKDLTPAYILFNFGRLYSILEDPMCSITKKDKTIEIKDFEKELQSFKSSIPIIKEEENYFAKVKDYKIKIRMDNKKIKVSCNSWNEITMSSSEINDTSMQDIVNEEGLYNVYFKNEGTIYSNGSYFENANLKDSVKWLLNYFHPCEELNNRDYEKLDGRMNSKKVKKWPSKSEFAFVEEFFKNDYDVIICDDYLKEWADYICIKENCVEFIACKGNGAVQDEDGSASASCFQEVIGQAIKNLGNFYPTDAQLRTKKEEWGKKYLKSKKKERVAHGTLDDGITKWQNAMNNPGYERISSLVVNFITKEGFEKNFEKMTKKMSSKDPDVNTFVEEPVYQQVMLISNFVHSCIEMNVIPKVYCPKKIKER